ncbi:Polysaccharide deacetylase [Spraguea lophii 42_110]|uniref:Polysaccharide deacetylase n=1 Tax=Spraguea lophii (strain 42_110) TaxID=1358809 RepID=S7XIF9_SPRLO|nr:Polysaccharide deacetylase [Spraguea lophii 42_110]
MFLFLFIIRIFTYYENKDKKHKVVLSFDEGPSKNIHDIIDILEVYRVPAVFHFDPLNDNHRISQYLIHRLKSNNYEIGLSITENLRNVPEEKAEKIIKKAYYKFVKLTDMVPLIVRLSRTGYDKNTIKIANRFNIIHTTPTIDSEDIDMVNFMDHLLPSIEKEYPKFISLVLRDRLTSNIYNLPKILSKLNNVGYDITPLYSISNFNTFAIPIKKYISTTIILAEGNQGTYDIKLSNESSSDI